MKVLEHRPRFTLDGMVNGSLVLTSAPPENSVPASSRVDDELRALARVRAGEVRAFEALYDQHHAAVLGMAMRRGCPAEEAEDVAHEVFLALWRRPPVLEGARLSTWLYRVTANHVASLHRGRRTRLLMQDTLARWSGRSARAEGASDQVEAGQAAQAILQRMSPKKREVLVLFELEELTGPEIAERLGCAEGTVWTRLHHARRELERIARRLGLEEDAT